MATWEQTRPQSLQNTKFSHGAEEKHSSTTFPEYSAARSQMLSPPLASPSHSSRMLRPDGYTKAFVCFWRASRSHAHAESRSSALVRIPTIIRNVEICRRGPSATHSCSGLGRRILSQRYSGMAKCVSREKRVTLGTKLSSKTGLRGARRICVMLLAARYRNPS